MKLTFKFGFNLFIKIFIMGSEFPKPDWQVYDKIWRNEVHIYRDKKEDHLIPPFNTAQAQSYLKNRIKKL